VGSDKVESFWQRVFSRPEPEVPQEPALDRCTSGHPAAGGAVPADRDAELDTGRLVQAAIERKEFDAAAFALVAKGRLGSADVVGSRALAEGKYSQAIDIFTRTGNLEKLALANELAGRDGLRRGGSRKTAMTRLFTAVQTYGSVLATGRGDRITIMKKIIVLCDDLCSMFDESSDFLRAADTALYAAHVCLRLASEPGVSAALAHEPDFFTRLGKKTTDLALRARTAYKQYVDAGGVSPESPEGRKVVARMQALQKVLAAVKQGLGTPEPR